MTGGTNKKLQTVGGKRTLIQVAQCDQGSLFSRILKILGAFATVYSQYRALRIVCVRAVCVFSRACVRVDVSCACCHERACASTSRVRVRRGRVVTSVRARRRLVCVCAVCVLSRACVRVDVSCACLLFVAGARALWTFGPFPAAISIKYILILISINSHPAGYYFS